MPYELTLTTAAAKDLRGLDADSRQRIGKKIDRLTTEPRPRGVEKLKGRENTYRIRVGAYRVLYEVNDKKLLVLVIRVRHRKDVYRTE